MKYKYLTPEIIVEELTRTDVLCASNEALGYDPDPDKVDNFTLGKSIWEALGGTF